MEPITDGDFAGRHIVQVHVGAHSRLYEALSIEAHANTTVSEIIQCVREKLDLRSDMQLELAEVIGDDHGEACKERRLQLHECPVAVQRLWPLADQSSPLYRFALRKKPSQPMNWSFSWADTADTGLLQDYFLRFLYQPKDREYSDLCQLPELTEQTLLNNLKARFNKSHIYTYVGSILVAINPFKFLPIYNPKYVQLYQNRRLGELPPHVFAIADNAYQCMRSSRRDQCIVISGESGSGKSESCNFLLHHLCALSEKGAGGGVEQILLAAGPVLEAFGNAKTIHNHNSSRFGKFLRVHYKSNGIVVGAHVQKYLLEKSRIVSQSGGERNYHVFYYLLSGCGATERARLRLTQAADYAYLGGGHCYTSDGVDETHEYMRLRQSLALVGFSPTRQRKLNDILAAILHLGNVHLHSEAYEAHEDVSVRVAGDAASEVHLAMVAKLLGVQRQHLVDALSMKHTQLTRSEAIVVRYSLQDALSTRDALAKCLYELLFEWLVNQVNHALIIRGELTARVAQRIGLLDIFGFEALDRHSDFEQLCINYANERLQQYFNAHVFQHEQEEYRNENIEWIHIKYADNSACLALLEARPYGFLWLLQDVCSLPNALAPPLLESLTTAHATNPLFKAPAPSEPQTSFVIRHYAGAVCYDVRNMREKNLDLIRPDLISLLKRSSNAFVRELVSSDCLALFRWKILKAFFRSYSVLLKVRRKCSYETGTILENGGQTSIVSSKLPPSGNIAAHCVRGYLFRATSSPSKLLNSPKRPISASFKDEQLMAKANQILKKSKLKMLYNDTWHPCVRSLKSLKELGMGNRTNWLNRNGRKPTPTIAYQFQQSLSQLMDTLSSTNAFFVRCIKSNSQKRPNCFNDELVLRQLRYTGILDTVRIRQQGYASRFTFHEFRTRYRILLSQHNDDIETLLKYCVSHFQIGRTKVYLREGEKARLDELLHDEILRRIIYLQQKVRCWLARKRFLRLRNAVITIQRHTRKWLKQKYQRKDAAARCIQHAWRRNSKQHSCTTLNVSLHSQQSVARNIQLLNTQMEKHNLQSPKPMSHEFITNLDDSADRCCAACKKHILQLYNPKSYRCLNCGLLLHHSCKGEMKRFECILPKKQTFKQNTMIHQTTFVQTTERVHSLVCKEMEEFKNASIVHNTQPITKQISPRNTTPKVTYNLPSQDAVITQDRVLKATQLRDSRDVLIADATELYYMEIFLGSKLRELQNTQSLVDLIFMSALKEFKENLLSTYSAASATRDEGDDVADEEDTTFGIGKLAISYSCLIEHFEHVTRDICARHATSRSFPVNMALNAFRTYLDEFRNLGRNRRVQVDSVQPVARTSAKKSLRRGKRKRHDDHHVLLRAGHRLTARSANMPTVCELCHSLMWLMEKALVCSECKLICHRRCLSSIRSCTGTGDRGSHSKRINKQSQRMLFGECLTLLVDASGQLPAPIQRLIAAIELRALYTEGIYRKSALASAVNELKHELQKEWRDASVLAPLERYNVHALAAVLKAFLRELPEPVIPFEFYDNFLWCANEAGGDHEEQAQAMFTHIRRLPHAHFHALARLSLHLARVAQHEHANRMGVTQLAIIFAPALLRPSHEQPLQDRLTDIKRQTQVLECIITQRLRQLRHTLADIQVLDHVRDCASSQLSTLKSHYGSDEHELSDRVNEEMLLTQQIHHLQSERQTLTSKLPSFFSCESDDEVEVLQRDNPFPELCVTVKQMKSSKINSIFT